MTDPEIIGKGRYHVYIFRYIGRYRYWFHNLNKAKKFCRKEYDRLNVYRVKILDTGRSDIEGELIVFLKNKK